MYLIKIESFFQKFFLYSGIHEGRNLMANADSHSFAAELEVLSKDEVRTNFDFFKICRKNNL